MKVTLDKYEIEEAVQHYIGCVLGSELKVTEINVVQGREANGARIEVDLVKSSSPIDLDDLTPVNVVQAEINTQKLEKSPIIKNEVKEPVAKKVSGSAQPALNLPVDDDEEDEDPIKVTEPDEVPELKDASVMTKGMQPLPGSFFGNTNK